MASGEGRGRLVFSKVLYRDHMLFLSILALGWDTFVEVWGRTLAHLPEHAGKGVDGDENAQRFTMSKSR